MLLQLDRYSVKELDTTKISVGDVVVAIVDDSNPQYPQKDWGEVTAINGEEITFHGEVTGVDYTVHRRKTYYPLDPVWADAVDRMVAGNMAVDSAYTGEPDVEFAERLRDGLFNERIVPGGRIQAMLGAKEVYGKDAELTAYNCYVIPSPKDSRRGIIETLGNKVEIMARGGGVGINLSTLRPKYAKVYGVNGTSSGAVSWGGAYSFTTGLIEQGGSRRGALMLQLHVTHPDIFEFITVKQTAGAITNANLSVQITAEFMEAVKQDADWRLIFPVTTHPEYEKWGEVYRDIHEWLAAGLPVEVYKTVKAREIYDLIVESAWKSAEPGFVVYDRMNDGVMTPTQMLVPNDDGTYKLAEGALDAHANIVPWNNTYYYQRNVCTNPCLHKDTYMVTRNGLEKISELKSDIHNTEGYVNSRAWKTGVKPVVRLMTNSGFEYVTTTDHRFLLADGTWESAINTIGKRIAFDLTEKDWDGIDPYNGEVDYRVLGFILGDGGWHKASKRMNLVYATPDKDAEVIDIVEKALGTEFSEEYGKFVARIPYGTIYADTFKGRIDERDIPDWIMQLPKPQMADFLKGLFSANGANLKKYNKIQLVSVNKEMLLKVQQMLLLFGIKGKLWYHNKEHVVEFANGEYTCRESYHLVISRLSYKKFLDSIGFIQSYKNGYKPTVDFRPEDTFETVILISEMGEAEVWDFNEPQLHRGITSGAIVHNCGEQPLPAWGVCNLVHINLAEFYDESVNDVNWPLLSQTVHDTVRFADNVIDYTPYHLEENREVQLGQRRIGMGTMGVADLLIDMKLRYGSPESIAFIDKLYGFIAAEAYKASALLAKDRGAFPMYNERLLNARVPQLLPDDVRGLIRKYGLRNSHLLTQAPTGTTGTKTGRHGYSVGTGVEPFFALSWVRESRMGKTHDYLGKARAWLDAHPGEELPDYFVSAMCTHADGSPKITPREHVDIQAAIQKWNDSAISKTANCPASYTIEQTSELYMYGYEKGLIGVTIYRDGSRDTQVLSVDKAEEEKPEAAVPAPQFRKRPKVLRGETIKTPTPFGKAYVTINRNEDAEVDEVFIKLGKTGADIAAISDGLAIALTGMLSPRIANLPQAQKIDWLTKKFRGISGATSVGFGPNRVESLPDAIAKVFTSAEVSEEYDTVPHTSVTSTDLCPNCGKSTFVRQDGCYTCMPDLGGCGHSKCA
ncbi:LAGLIDADG family homing endonuclease [uncultured Paenibacillus sp.]|uniref:LAGLIDADG family homing endonuclease n=1 Tax=uncultured Paenibacillus sp. TaxID=227322 RepID=UPI0015AD0671|nr:LAGLIDADG family homing endonuclease [uncultured Paenibacillus sp.]